MNETEDHRATELHHAEFTAMPDPAAEKPPETFSSDISGVRAAAEELQARRAEEEPTTERAYVNLDGELKGERRPLTESVSLNRAARDLHSARASEQAAAQESGDLSLREHIDQIRAEAHAQEALKAHAERQAQQPDQLQPQPEASPETTPQQTNGLDPEVAKALENPKIREAIQQQVAATEQARQSYMAAVQQISQAATANLLAQFPELQGVTQESFLPVMRAIQQRDPGRAQAIANHVRAAEAQMQQIQQVQMQQQRQAAQQFNTYAQAEDSKFEAFEKTRPASEAKAVRENIATVLKEDFGIDLQALSQIYDSNPAFRSVEAQKLIYAAVRNSLAQRSIHKAPRTAGRVLRPGEVSAPGVDYSELAEKMRSFRDAPTAKSAAAALMARRRAAANQR